MFNSHIVRRSVALVAFVSGIAGMSGAGLGDIIDTTYGAGAGSFELGNFTGAAFDYRAPGSTGITGWTVGGPGDGVDWLHEPTFGADTGTRSIDMMHLQASSISTDIPTNPGEIYRVTFRSAAVVGHDNQGIVSAGSMVAQPFAPAFSGAFATQVYYTFTFDFTATGATTTLEFECVGNLSPAGQRYGPVLDSVSVVSVPGPSGAALLLAGLACGVSRRRCAR